MAPSWLLFPWFWTLTLSVWERFERLRAPCSVFVREGEDTVPELKPFPFPFPFPPLFLLEEAASGLGRLLIVGEGERLSGARSCSDGLETASFLQPVIGKQRPKEHRSQFPQYEKGIHLPEKQVISLQWRLSGRPQAVRSSTALFLHCPLIHLSRVHGLLSLQSEAAKQANGPDSRIGGVDEAGDPWGIPAEDEWDGRRKPEG